MDSKIIIETLKFRSFEHRIRSQALELCQCHQQCPFFTEKSGNADREQEKSTANKFGRRGPIEQRGGVILTDSEVVQQIGDLSADEWGAEVGASLKQLCNSCLQWEAGSL